jgi:hypothetical protein
MIPAPVAAAIAETGCDTETGCDSETGCATGAASSWPLASHLELGALDSAVPCARMHAKNVVIEWGLAALADPTELIVAELTTNAVCASKILQLPAFSFCMASNRNCVLIRVRDGSKHAPTSQHADPLSERGRGLLLVDALSVDWGWYREPDGKVVWALVGPPGFDTAGPPASLRPAPRRS